MELELKIAEVFNTKNAPNTPADTNSVLELKKIEQQLNQHMKNKQGLKYKKICITNDKTYNEKKFTEIIDNELYAKMANKKWKGLPMFMKWQLLEVFMAENNILDIESIKSKLLNNTLQVEYENKKVLKIT